MSKFLKSCRRHTAAMLAFGIALAAPSAWAAGTASDTSITNNAQVNYQVGGVSQTTQSNAATFKVDNIVRLLVSESGSSATSVIPGATGQVLTFSVTNQGNTTQDYALSVNSSVANGQTLTLGATTYTDAFDPVSGSCQTWVESGAQGGLQTTAPNADTQVNSISNLAADASRTVYVVCSIPLGLSNGADSLVTLTATTANAGSCATSCATTAQTDTADNPTQVDVVFGDVAGVEDSARDGKHSARDAYEVTSAALSISKTVTPICDPFNFNDKPKNIPGAYVRYEITVANAAGSGQSATLTTITDALPASLAYDPDLKAGSASACSGSTAESAAGSGFKLSCTGGGRTCATTSVYYTGASDTDAVTVSGQTVTVTAGNTPTGAKVLGTEAGYAPGELKPGESITIRFNAIIQ
jgi:hypothetical protein